jgi:pimeloyl-ACP methyl ester carboxylesterase
VKRAALVAVALVGGAAGPSIGSAQAATPGIGWRACGDGLECARVAVPLDWSRPKGKQISLAVIRHPASDPGQRIGSMFFNPGGPGVSGVDTLRAQADTLDADGGGRFDVVSWDPRGTNASTHARCFASATAESRFWGPAPFPVGAAQSRTYIAKTVAVDRRCGSLTTPGLLDHISTADTARDLDRLRALVSFASSPTSAGPTAR